MGLRAKLVAIVFVPLICAIVALGIISLDRMLRGMADGLVRSGDRVAKETYEQMRGALASARHGTGAALRNDRGLRTTIESAHAFGEYVVWVRIVSPDGTVMVAAEPGLEGRKEPAE